MNLYIKIEIPVQSGAEADRLVAELSDTGFYAFEEEPGKLTGYILSGDYDEKKLSEILPPAGTFIKSEIEEENWNEKWEQQIQPVRIDDFALIRPSFSAPVKEVMHDILITPKMSFGTGHHATTFLMIREMAKTDFSGKAVIDFGTGTGILAILAEKCGAQEITAVDHDEWSIENAAENIANNHCVRITVGKKDNLEGLRPADIMLANINLNVLAAHAESISGLLKPGGLLLASGFLTEDEGRMQNIFSAESVFTERISRMGEWSAILFRKVQEEL